MYRHLNPDRTVATIDTLRKRIEERFPASGLSNVCRELHAVARVSKERAEWIGRPHYTLRLAVGCVIVLALAAMAYSLSRLDISITRFDGGQLVQITEAAMNEVVLVGASIFFLVSIEIRIKRARSLRALHELRTIAHVIDMHQLTKDPSRFGKHVILTPSSPREDMSAYELIRYLDYCSEMLSLTGKVAALYTQNFMDAVVVSAVNDLEALTTGLSRKIWQKIMILYKFDENEYPGSRLDPAL